MLPVPTATGAATFAGAVAALLIGVFASSPAAVAVGGGILIGIGAALAATMPVGRRARRERLEFAWWLAHGSSGGGAVIPTAPFEVQAFIRHRGARRHVASDVRPLFAPPVEHAEPAEDTLLLEPRARTDFAFRLRAPAAGRVVLHGLALSLRGPLGLFEVPLYFPNALTIKVLPRAAARSRAGVRAVSGLTVERGGRNPMRRRGGGTELYELRERAPGDPFNSIAWKASARFGRLMVKEVEREVQETRWVVLDVSGSMRAGAPGRRKLDFAIEAAAAEARQSLREGDRVGLLAVDGRIVAQVPARDDATQMPRLYEALLATTEVVDEDLTDVDERELVQIVGRYIRHQEGIDFARRGREGGWDLSELLRHVGRALEASDEHDLPIRASSSVSRALRAFCRARGLSLPYRPDPRDGSKGPALASALHQAGGNHRSPSVIFVVTDFDGVTDTASLLSALKLMRAHGHTVIFVMPDSVSFAPPTHSTLEDDLLRVYARGEHRRQREARKVLGPLGVPVVIANASDPAAAVLDRAERRVRAA